MSIEGILRLQAGVIGRDQALAAGLSARQIEYRVKSGKWTQVHSQVYVVADREVTDHTKVWAAYGAGTWRALIASECAVCG